MPKNNNSSGARAPKNFDPRYSERAKNSKHGIGQSHRGYQAPVERDAASKGRWNADERSARATGEANPRFERRERGDMRDNGGAAPSRGASSDRGGYNRPERPARDGGYSRDSRPVYNRADARPARDGERSGGYNRDERPARDGGYSRDSRPAYNRDARPARDGERPAYGNRTERPAFNRDSRPSRDGERPAYNRERPTFREGGRDSAPRAGGRDFAPREGGRDFKPREGGRDFAPRSGGRDFTPREGGRDFTPRSGGRDFTPREGGRDFKPREGGRDFAPRSGGRDFTPREGGRDFKPREGGRDFAPRSGGRDFRPREGGRDFAPRDGGRTERPRFDREQRSNNGRSDWAKDSKKSFENQEDVVRERLDAKAVSAGDVAETTFADLGLGENIVRVLNGMGAAKPFPIQAATIPAILAGRDTLGRGRTGSGKTIAFGAPVVEAILRTRTGGSREFGRKPSAIIIAPTRELALQIDGTIQPIARSVGLFTTQIYGGVPQARQVGALQKGVDIIIGTPGRIEDLIEQRKLDLSEVQFAILDEADHMCELGFLEPVQRILRKTKQGSQKLLFSATLDAEVEALVREFLVDPAVYEVAGEDQDSGNIEHRVLVVDHRDKPEILTSLVDRAGKTLVFTRTRAYAEMLTMQFEDAGIPAVALHGDLNQAKRTRNLQRMTSGRVDVLVATDVAARGIHVDDIDLVVQADAPDEYKTYMHRSGRTGRAGNSGRVVTLIPRQRRNRMAELLERAEIDAPFDDARAGDEVIEEIAGRTPTLAEVTA